MSIGRPIDYEEGNIEYLRVWGQSAKGEVQWFCSYDLTTPIDDPAAGEIFNRPRQRDVNSDSFYRTVQGWLRECFAKHGCCDQDSSKVLPTRLIDVGRVSFGSRLRLHKTAKGEEGRYVALSYCWGKAQSVITTTQNVNEYHTSLDLDSLHQSVRDAVLVTRKLGIPYLWVDALCIIQDDLEDKAREISSMGEIYRNAYLSIIAARASNVDEGFLTPSAPYHQSNSPDKRFRFPYRCSDGRMGEVWVEQVYAEYEARPLDGRGWAMQELVLTPRALIYQPSIGVEWDCFDNGRFNGPYLQKLLTADGPSIDASVATCQTRDQVSLRTETWEGIIRTYSSRNLSFPDDKFFAIEGVARQLNKSWGDIYLAGLWRSNIMRLLSWHITPKFTWSEDHQKKFHFRPQLAEYRAPTWSWASTDESVDFYTRLCNYFVDYAELLEYEITPVVPDNSMGQLRFARITIRASSISCRGVVLDDSCWKWSLKLDDGSNELDDPRSGIAKYVFLGYVYWHTSREGQNGADETKREATGLILMPAKNDTFRRIGMFVINEPEAYELYSGLFPCKAGDEVKSQVLNIV